MATPSNSGGGENTTLEVLRGCFKLEECRLQTFELAINGAVEMKVSIAKGKIFSIYDHRSRTANALRRWNNKLITKEQFIRVVESDCRFEFVRKDGGGNEPPFFFINLKHQDKKGLGEVSAWKTLKRFL